MAKYIDNELFNSQLVEYLVACDEAEAAGNDIPVIPNEIAVSFIKIAEGLGSTYRFSRYTYLDEMISDAVEDCTVKIRNYDYKKYNNPFSYFTQICWFAFIGIINNEYKQKKIIYKACEQLSLEDFKLDADDADTNNMYLEFLRENIEQKELERIQGDEGEKKFVHRMITKHATKPTVVAATNALSFDD